MLNMDLYAPHGADGVSGSATRDSDAASSTSTASHVLFLTLARVIRWGPVAAIVAVLLWSYYVFVAVIERSSDDGYGWSQLFHLLAFHACLLMLVWTFVVTICTPPGSVPEAWRLSPAMVASLEGAETEDQWKRYLEMFAVQMGVSTVQRSVQGAIRYCEKCRKIKPDRCHHCSVCNNCVLKMDHHCPWVNNCVGFANYKFFMLFLFYSYVYCFIVAEGIVEHLFFSDQKDRDDEGQKTNVFLLGLVVLFLFAFQSSLFWYHVFLIVCNRSTLEQFRAPVLAGGREDKYAWSLGRRKNVQQVFGANLVRALLPVGSTPGDGMHYPRSRKCIARHEGAAAAASDDVPAVSAAPAEGSNGAANGKDHISVAVDSKLGASSYV